MSLTAPPAVPVLDTTDEIDDAWLTAALSARHPGVEVRGVTARPIGAGNVSDTVHLTIDYGTRPPGAPEAVVAKFRPRSPEVHQHGLGSGAYHREIGGYRAITERGAARIPVLFHVDGDETNINLVIEDLTDATPGNQVAGCGVDEAAAVLTQLARLHATFTPQDPATAPAWPIRMTEAADYWSPSVRRGAALVADRFRDRLPQADLDVVAAAADIAHDWHLLPQTRLTLTHGDPRVDNVLFEHVYGGIRAVLIDWQVTGLRNPMYDVGYFLSGSLDADLRRVHERRLIEDYLRQFGAIAPGYSPEEAFEDYRTQVLSGLMITTAAVALLPDVEQVNTLILALLERNCAAAHDWDGIAATRSRSAR
ncbi:phosphotransferase family protein [Actinomycetospora chiangmaiensis]|uniref:phosphotransferase family protein n=1 Tax=Actinomycetospora chiangmaiensis TaxID=402650 RepID=UPI0004766140|nr:phosphotransferase [Actinomycetospora chiangmaiensis]